MKHAELKLQTREEVGGGRAGRLRNRGLIPAVVYGKGVEAKAACVNGNDLRAFLKNNGRNSVFNTEFAQESDISVLIKDIQYDPVRKDIIHLDFQRVNANEKIQVEVPVRIIGRESVEKEGNVISRQLDMVSVECLPGDIPQYVDADITGMKHGHSLTAGELIFHAGVSLLSKPSDVVLSVNRREKEPEPEPESETFS